MRADSITRYLISTGDVQKDNIYAAGFADTRPIALNDSPEDRALNRRVDIKILYDQPNDYIPPDDILGPEKANKE